MMPGENLPFSSGSIHTLLMSERRGLGEQSEKRGLGDFD
jgi:hypothetical protein